MKKFLLIIGILQISLFLHAQTHVSGGVLKPEQALMDIRHYNIVLDVRPDQGYYEGYTEIKLNLLEATSAIILDLDSLFTISGIWVDGVPAGFKHASGLIRITGKEIFSAGSHMVKVAYGGKPHIAVNPPWDGGIQWSRDSLGRHWVAMSCQEDGADIFFPCKDHPSDEPNEGVDMVITVPKGMVVAGPGLLKLQQTKGTKTTWHWKTN